MWFSLRLWEFCIQFLLWCILNRLSLLLFLFFVLPSCFFGFFPNFSKIIFTIVLFPALFKAIMVWTVRSDPKSEYELARCWTRWRLFRYRFRLIRSRVSLDKISLDWTKYIRAKTLPIFIVFSFQKCLWKLVKSSRL